MKTRNIVLRKTALAAAVVLLVGGVSTMDGSILGGTGYAWMSSAYAAEDGSGKGSGGQKGAMGEGRGGQGAQGAGGAGYRGGKSVKDVLAEDDDGDDSDRPGWAGVPGGEGRPGGGGNPDPGTTKGDDYGDLFVVLRNPDGSIVTDGDEHYVLLSDGTVVKTVDGEVPADASALAVPVEFGRMNIARSPATVLDHALVEALSKLDGTVIRKAIIDRVTDAAGRLMTEDGVTIDSPLENLALYVALLTATNTDGDRFLDVIATASKDGEDTTYEIDVGPGILLDLAAAALAASSDKTGSLSADEVMLISEFLGVDDELSAMMDTYTYSRDTAYKDVTVSVLVPNEATEDPGDYITVTGPVLELINTYAPDTWTDIVQPVVGEYSDGDTVEYADQLSGIYLFTQAVDDAVQVLEFVHDNSAPE